jgi:hypothetical protein
MSNIITPSFRVSYPNVFKPKRNELNGKDEYSLVALFPKGADLSQLKAAAMAAIEKKWPNPATRPQNIRTPFRKHEDRIKDGKLPAGYEAGGIYINLKSSVKPGVVNQQVQDIIDPQDFYAGCYARAAVTAFAYDQKGNRGVSFGLQNLQKVKDGDPLGSRTLATDDFAPLEAQATELAAGGDATSLFD